MSGPEYHAQCLRLNATDMVSDQHPEPFHDGEALMIPARMAKAAITAAADDAPEFITIMLSGGAVGLFVSYTSEGARMFAAKLVEMADIADIAVAASATAAINKARGK